MKNVCCFAGHSQILESREKIAEEIYNTAKALVINENVTEFWAGNYGDFDRMCAGVINRLKKEFADVKINLVIPYLTKTIDEYKDDYDSIVMANMPENMPYRYRILECNEYMIKNSKFLICYVKNTWGGAQATLRYAQKQKHITIFNLAQSDRVQQN